VSVVEHKDQQYAEQQEEERMLTVYKYDIGSIEL
jgi:hypothetical protein